MQLQQYFKSTLGSEVLYLSHVSAPHKITYFLPNWPCTYGMTFRVAHWDTLHGSLAFHCV